MKKSTTHKEKLSQYQQILFQEFSLFHNFIFNLHLDQRAHDRDFWLGMFFLSHSNTIDQYILWKYRHMWVPTFPLNAFLRSTSIHASEKSYYVPWFPSFLVHQVWALQKENGLFIFSTIKRNTYFAPWIFSLLMVLVWVVEVVPALAPVLAPVLVPESSRKFLKEVLTPRIHPATDLPYSGIPNDFGFKMEVFMFTDSNHLHPDPWDKTPRFSPTLVAVFHYHSFSMLYLVGTYWSNGDPRTKKRENTVNEMHKIVIKQKMNILFAFCMLKREVCDKSAGYKTISRDVQTITEPSS